MKDSCVFCKIIRGELPVKKVYEDAWVLCFLDNDPISTGHVLIITKNHVLDADELPDDTARDIMGVSQNIVRAIKKATGCDGYTIMQNGGVFNEIGHYHMHVIPRKIGDGFTIGDTQGEKEYDEEIARKIRQAL